MALVTWNIRLIATYGVLNRHEVNGLGAEYVREDCGLLLGVGRGGILMYCIELQN